MTIQQANGPDPIVQEQWLFDEVDQDVKYLSGLMASAADKALDPLRRSYVRAVLAMIEGTAWQLKQLALSNPKCRDVLDSQTITLLEEKVPSLDKNGGVISQQAKLKTAHNILFAINSFGLVYGYGQKLVSSSEPEYAKLKQCIEVRDRLVHPKTIQGLKVTDGELRVVNETYQWYRGFTREIMIWGLLLQRHGTSPIEVLNKVGTVADVLNKVSVRASTTVNTFMQGLARFFPPQEAEGVVRSQDEFDAYLEKKIQESETQERARNKGFSKN